MNKMGFNKDSSSDTILYIILVVVLMIFVFNMSDIYQFVSKVKTGEIFKKETTTSTETDKPEKPKEDKYEIVTPKGENYGVCKKTFIIKDGEIESTVKVYHTDYKLKSIVEELKYNGSSDEFTNYIYSENNKYKTRKEKNKNLKGYSIIPTLSNNTLKVSSIIDLKQVSLDDIKLSKNEGLEIKGKYNQDTVVLTQEYVDLGYVCEW